MIGRFKKGKDHPSWKGGKITDANGYTRVAVEENHPLGFAANGQRKGYYAYEHQLVVYNHLHGEVDLKGKQVHHRNENKTDNRIENLILFLNGNGDHVAYHRYRDHMSEAEALARIGAKNLEIFDFKLSVMVDRFELLYIMERELGVKKCIDCETVKLDSEFTKRPNLRDGLDSYCRSCVNARNRKSYARTKTQVVPHAA